MSDVDVFNLDEFLANYHLPRAGTTLTTECLQNIGEVNRQFAVTLGEHLWEAIVGDDGMEHIALMAPSQVIELLCALWKKLKPEDRKPMFDTKKRQINDAVKASLSIERSDDDEDEPEVAIPKEAPKEPKAREVRAAKLVANSALKTLLSKNEKAVRKDRKKIQMASQGTKDLPIEVDVESSSSSEPDQADWQSQKLLLEPRKWKKLPQEANGTMKERMRNYASFHKMDGWNREVTDSIIEALEIWRTEPQSPRLPQLLIDEVLTRFKLYAEGFGAERIENTVKQIRNNQLPKRLQGVFPTKQTDAKPSHQTSSFRPSNNSSNSGGHKSSTRVPPELWKMLTEEQRKVLRK